MIEDIHYSLFGEKLVTFELGNAEKLAFYLDEMPCLATEIGDYENETCKSYRVGIWLTEINLVTRLNEAGSIMRGNLK